MYRLPYKNINKGVYTSIVKFGKIYSGFFDEDLRNPVNMIV